LRHDQFFSVHFGTGQNIRVFRTLTSYRLFSKILAQIPVTLFTRKALLHSGKIFVTMPREKTATIFPAPKKFHRGIDCNTMPGLAPQQPDMGLFPSIPYDGGDSSRVLGREQSGSFQIDLILANGDHFGLLLP